MIESVTCPIDGCSATAPRGKLMCKPHWRMVPLDVQQEVHRTWGEFCDEKDPQHKLTFRRGYILARTRAIQAVNALLSKNRPRPGEETA